MSSFASFTENSYRVLFTRARERLIPEGDDGDPTRIPLFDAIP